MGEILPQCAECGQTFLQRAPEEVLCGPCGLRYKALEPSEELRDMRFVYNGGKPVTAGQKMLKQMMDRTPKEFLQMKRVAEREYKPKFDHARLDKSENVYAVIDDLLRRIA